MAIVPAGKLRFMEAQNFNSPFFGNNSDPEKEIKVNEEDSSSTIGESPSSPEASSLNNSSIPEIEEEDSLREEGAEDTLNDDGVDDGVEDISSKGGEITLVDYVFKTLEGFGYPGRRLQEFKKKFINQDISSDGTETVKIEIPDKHYPDQTGEVKTIETVELTKIVKEIKNLFDLNFTGAHRSEGKWTIDFTSGKIEREEDKDQLKDILDETYGNPGGGGKKTHAGSNSILLKLAEIEKEKFIKSFVKIK